MGRSDAPGTTGPDEAREGGAVATLVVPLIAALMGAGAAAAAAVQLIGHGPAATPVSGPPRDVSVVSYGSR